MVRQRMLLKKEIKQNLVADRHDLNKSRGDETRMECHINVAHRFSTLEGSEISSVNDTWVNISDIIRITASAEVFRYSGNT